MTSGIADDRAGVDVHSEIPTKSWKGWHKASAPTSSSGSCLWKVQIYRREHKVTRVASYGPTTKDAVPEYKEPEEVIWPTWPATIEDEAAVTASPLADLQRYWSTASNRLRESAKWMATVLGAALAAVIGTSPLANLSSHHFQVISAGLGIAGLFCLAITMLLVLRVMQPPEVSFEQIEGAGTQVESGQSSGSSGQLLSSWMSRQERSALCRWKRKIESHKDLYLPCGIESLGELRWYIGLEEATLVQLTRRSEGAPDAAAVDELKGAQEARAARLLELRTAAARITAIGEFYAVQARSSWATYGGTTLGFLGTAFVVLAFAWH
jgi:hypothetical protein